MSGAAGESVRSGGGSAWYRATYADGEPAGFVMLHDENLRPEPSASPAIELWRFMVDADRQGRGIGREDMALVLRMRASVALSSCSCPTSPAKIRPRVSTSGLGIEPMGDGQALTQHDEVALKALIDSTDGRLAHPTPGFRALMSARNKRTFGERFRCRLRGYHTVRSNPDP